MKVITVTATVSDGRHCAMARWSDREGEKSTITVDGMTLMMDPHGLELLYDALHELFARPPASGRGEAGGRG